MKKHTSAIALSLFSLLLLSACKNSEKNAEAANAWVAVDKHGSITLFGQPHPDLESFQASLYDSLSKMQELPATVPVHFDQEVLMGMRGEVETGINQALATAQARKECEAVIHGFYAWYDVFQKDDSRSIIFTNNKGKHLKLDEAKLDTYLGHFKASGFVGAGFIETQKSLYKSCEKLWQTEAIDEVPSCLDGDPYFCAQDWEMDFWTKSPVFIDLAGDKVSATMRGTEGGSPKEQDFELVKENGKWVIVKIQCDMIGTE